MNEQGEIEILLLVKWQALTNFEKSWELVARLREHFPRFLLPGEESFERMRSGIKRGKRREGGWNWLEEG